MRSTEEVLTYQTGFGELTIYSIIALSADACSADAIYFYLTGSPTVQRTSSSQKLCQGLCPHIIILR